MTRLTALLLALSLLLTLTAPVLCEEADTEPAATSPSRVAVGDRVFFGRFEQDNNLDNGPEDIEWMVLDVKGSRALLLSVWGLLNRPYNTVPGELTWAECSLRVWLNEDFLDAAFTKPERRAILNTRIDNSQKQCKPDWKSVGGENTRDRVFLLSAAEVETYFGDLDTRKVWPTKYALAGGARVYNNDRAGWWWLRSPGVDQQRAAMVNVVGETSMNYVRVPYGCARPAIWVNLKYTGF
ncbi:MAG: hypothetical protein IKP40_02045 [Clostridia bacterium]|nr:hypothetical protein [Clostridia bacterium]